MRDGRPDDGAGGYRRRGGAGPALALGAALAITLLASPAGAAPPAASGSASAYWAPDDGRNTSISVQGSTGDTPRDPDGLFLFVNQSYCDTAADELVFRSFTSSAPLEDGSFWVHPQLKAARLKALTTVTGYEQRYPSCTSPSFPGTSTSLGASTIDADVRWDATGDVYEVQPGITARSAVATGSITGSMFSIGQLGSSDFAEIRGSAT